MREKEEEEKTNLCVGFVRDGPDDAAGDPQGV